MPPITISDVLRARDTARTSMAAEGKSLRALLDMYEMMAR